MKLEPRNREKIVFFGEDQKANNGGVTPLDTPTREAIEASLKELEREAKMKKKEEQNRNEKSKKNTTTHTAVTSNKTTNSTKPTAVAAQSTAVAAQKGMKQQPQSPSASDDDSDDEEALLKRQDEVVLAFMPKVKTEELTTCPRCSREVKYRNRVAHVKTPICRAAHPAFGRKKKHREALEAAEKAFREEGKDAEPGLGGSDMDAKDRQSPSAPNTNTNNTPNTLSSQTERDKEVLSMYIRRRDGRLECPRCSTLVSPNGGGKRNHVGTTNCRAHQDQFERYKARKSGGIGETTTTANNTKTTTHVQEPIPSSASDEKKANNTTKSGAKASTGTKRSRPSATTEDSDGQEEGAGTAISSPIAASQTSSDNSLPAHRRRLERKQKAPSSTSSQPEEEEEDDNAIPPHPVSRSRASSIAKRISFEIGHSARKQEEVHQVTDPEEACILQDLPMNNVPVTPRGGKNAAVADDENTEDTTAKANAQNSAANSATSAAPQSAGKGGKKSCKKAAGQKEAAEELKEGVEAQGQPKNGGQKALAAKKANTAKQAASAHSGAAAARARPPPPHVTRFTLAHLHEVGVPFLLSNKHCGVLFKDGSCMMMDPTSALHYRNPNGHRFTAKSFTGQISVPRRLKRKLNAVLYTRDLLCTGREPMYPVEATATRFELAADDAEEGAAEGMAQMKGGMESNKENQQQPLPAAVKRCAVVPFFLVAATPVAPLLSKEGAAPAAAGAGGPAISPPGAAPVLPPSALPGASRSAATGEQVQFVVSNKSALYPDCMYYCSDEDQ